MLDYLLALIEKNIMLICFIVLVLSIASFYSKNTKRAFIFITAVIASYFAMLCLQKLHIGPDSFYNATYKYVYALCAVFEKITGVLPEHNLIFMRIFNSFAFHTIDALSIAMFVTFIIITICRIIKPFFVKSNLIKKEININNKNEYVVKEKKNYITCPLFILKDAFRC